MMRILLAEHSPHAQRMGERILREEGHTIVTVTDGDTAMLRLQDVKPEVVIAALNLRGFSGLQISGHIKNTPELRDTAVILSVGALEIVDEQSVQAAKADGVIHKPFEASALLEMVSRFAKVPVSTGQTIDRTGAIDSAQRTTRSVVVLDPAQVKAAVTVALDESLEPLIDRVTERVLAALSSRR